ncbi:MAG: NADP(H)-dependent aldo-keto reductase [Chromatiaceae bacterium]|nr:NADP(H)-dependent aldo-keto reductase [Chromatiaceae bacterium]MCP5422477.1 NADP(H)-dependent aldo-keto reductase [Chromatiaceae bacterium]
MIYRPLADTGIDVSALCLGTMTFGEQNDQAEAFEQLDMALDAGVNVIDTAEMYAIPPRAQTMGSSETIIGRWLAQRRCRDRVVIATKVCGPGRDWLTYIRGGDNHLDRANIQTAVDDSLRRLQTDVIDLYQLHWPERRTNCFGELGYRHVDEHERVSLLHTLQALGDLVTAGKIRHVGVSNETPWGLMRFLALADAHGLPRVVSIQNPYSLLNRSFEVGLAEVSHRERVGLLAYSPLGFGVLSGKYLGDRRPQRARLTLYPHYDRYSNAQAVAATAAYVSLAGDHGLDPAQMALAYVTQRPFVTSNIIGATSPAQLRSNLASADLVLSDTVLDAIETIHTAHPNPSP